LQLGEHAWVLEDGLQLASWGRLLLLGLLLLSGLLRLRSLLLLLLEGEHLLVLLEHVGVVPHLEGQVVALLLNQLLLLLRRQ
jgi:hypothetical protein